MHYLSTALALVTVAWITVKPGTGSCWWSPSIYFLASHDATSPRS